MPRPEYSHRPHKAVLWVFSGRYDRSGQPEVSAPVEIDVRWNENEANVTTPKEGTIRVDATVIVAQAVAIGSRMYRGRLTDLTGGAAPTGQTMEVKTTSAIDDIKGRNTARELGLIRMRDT